MTMVGLNFTKIVAERKVSTQPNLKVENNIGITNILEAQIPDPKKSLIKFEFSFTSKYLPDTGSIELSGELLEIYDKEFAAKVLNHWKENKKLHKDVVERIMNTILSRSHVEGIVISRELNLPTPVSMPKVEVKERPAAEKPEQKETKKKK
jgi:chorismate mutase